MSQRTVQERATALVASGNSGIAQTFQALSENQLAALTQARLAQAGAHQTSSVGGTNDLTVGLGRYIYLRMSPQDQQFVSAAGAAAVVALVCAASAGTACVVAGFAAAAIVAWVQTYGQSRCWVELKITYAGRFAGVNRVYNCT